MDKEVRERRSAGARLMVFLLQPATIQRIWFLHLIFSSTPRLITIRPAGVGGLPCVDRPVDCCSKRPTSKSVWWDPGWTSWLPCVAWKRSNSPPG